MTNQLNYTDFLERKKHSIDNSGFKANYVPDMAFDFQEEIITRACRKGRIAVFADTGLGKTLIQLSIAQNVVNHTNKKVIALGGLNKKNLHRHDGEKIHIEKIDSLIQSFGINLDSEILFEILIFIKSLQIDINNSFNSKSLKEILEFIEKKNILLSEFQIEYAYD